MSCVIRFAYDILTKHLACSSAFSRGALDSTFMLSTFVAAAGVRYITFVLTSITLSAVLCCGQTQTQAPTVDKAASAETRTTAKVAPPVPPKAPQWVGKIGGGVQFEGGRTASRGVSIAGDATKVFTANNILSIDGSVAYATYQVLTLPRTDATNNSSFAGQYVHRLNNRLFLADRVMFNRDVIIGVSHREINASGVGINLWLTPKGQFYVVPAFGVGHQLTEVRAINGLATGFVSYQKFTYRLNSLWSIDQYSTLRTSTRNSHDLSIRVYGGVSAPALFKRLFLSVGLDYNYEGDYAPAVIGGTRNDAIFSVKFNYRIGD